ncbi:hypothetical protein CVPH_0092 [Abyssogena phaseoliformis symbiont OG214]|nr:hypothetical protein CVPH_0092 [Abyssogena phaseoliformis symbiont OG214]
MVMDIGVVHQELLVMGKHIAQLLVEIPVTLIVDPSGTKGGHNDFPNGTYSSGGGGYTYISKLAD